MNKLKNINANSLEKAKPFLIIALHIVFLVVVFYFMSFQDSFRGISELKRWDATWYESIAIDGYKYSATEASNSGFFPFFSFIWRVTCLGDLGISVLNAVFFITGLFLLKKAFSFSNTFFLIALSIPSMMFMYVPYTEALFFLATSIFLYGLIKNNPKAIYLGLFIASITRPTAVFFIPSIVFMELMHHKDIKTTVLTCLKYAAVSLIGVLIVVVVQFASTGVWFAYFKAQSNSWNRVMQLPELPFTTWDANRILWLDGTALFFGLLAFTFVLFILVKKWLRKKEMDVDKATLFSFSYLSLAVFSVIFFNGKDVTGGTSLMGANRYILATPFFVILLNYLSTHLSKEITLAFLAFAVAIITAFAIGGGDFIWRFDHAFTNRYVLLTCVYMLSYLLLGTKYRANFSYVIYVINAFAQIYVLSHFTTDLWIG